MSRDEDKLIRQLSLLSFLLSRPRPFTAREVQESVEGYADMSNETFARRFHADRTDLAKIGIDVQILSSADTAEADEAQLYFLPVGHFRLPGVDLSPTEQKALSLALAALDGRFAYARPLRLALTAILRGRQDPVREELEQLPVAFAPDEDARLAGRQLARLEDAVARGKTVTFPYPTSEGGQQDRVLDPYSLFLIQSHWYVVGRDHQRDAIRTFRVGRIRGPVKFLSEKPRDFSVPLDYDPEEYRARPPWLIGPVCGTATIRVGEDLAWWVKRLQPHISCLADDDGCARFAAPFADDFLLLSWVTSLGGCAEILEPLALREEMKELLDKVARAHAAPLNRDDPPGTSRDGTARATVFHGPDPAEDKIGPIAPEHLARAIVLLQYLVDDKRPGLVSWQTLESDLGLDRAEVADDLSLINLVNFGGGTYALTAEALPEGVQVVREVMADTFSQPARLSPVMARAVLLALDLLGDAFALEGLESLASVREKVRKLIGEDHPQGTVIVDEVLPPDPQIVSALNRAIRDHKLVALEYFTTSRRELSDRLVEPYFLFHSPDGWYLEGFCLKAEGQRTFKLERIRSARQTDTVFAPRAEMDLTRRLTGEVLLSDDLTTVATVNFHPRWRTYLEERGTKCVLRPTGEVEASVPYLDERWIVQEVIRYLGDAILERPLSARQRIMESALAMAVRYENDAPAEPRTTPTGGDV
jgi:predicted DNA-binding transcriptional regulator YafY